MNTSRPRRRSNSFPNARFHLGAVALALGATMVAGGCRENSGSSTPVSAVPGTPIPQNATFTGQYNVVLTSTTGRGTTNIYSNFTQSGTTLTGAANTLVCPANDLSQCKGGDPPAVSIVLSGTVSGANVTITISFPSPAGADTLAMTGTAKGTALAGTYTDTQGDSGNWAASTSIHPFGPPPSVYDYTGTLNSTTNPLMIAPSISIELGQNFAS